MKNKFYVYMLIDPRNDKPFYVGKGTGRRKQEHIAEAKRPQEFWTNTLKCRRICAILRTRGSVITKVVYDHLLEEEAYTIESSLIKQYGRLINKTGILTNIMSEDKINPRKYKKVDQYSLDYKLIQTYDSIQEAAGAAGVSVNVMSGVVHSRTYNGKTMRTAGGFLWVLHGTQPPIYDRYEAIYKKKFKRIRQLNMNNQIINEFESQKEASEKTGVHVSHISSCCNPQSRRKSAGGFKWEIIDTSLV